MRADPTSQLTRPAHSACGVVMCSHCGQRIGPNELIWRQLDSGTVRASYMPAAEGLQQRAHRLWHPGCLPRGMRHELLAA